MKREYVYAVLFNLIAITLVVGIGGQTAKLTCTRLETDEPVNCINQTSLYWMIPIGQQEIRDVRGTDVHKSVNREGDTVFRINFLTPGGDVRLDGFSHQYARPYDTANRIDTFVRASNDKSLEMTDSGWGLSGGFGCFALWVLSLIALAPVYVIWEKRKMRAG